VSSLQWCPYYSCLCAVVYTEWVTFIEYIVSNGLFTLREGDPRRRNNFSLGLGAKISVRVMPKETRFERELKMAGEKTENAQFGHSSSFYLC